MLFVLFHVCVEVVRDSWTISSLFYWFVWLICCLFDSSSLWLSFLLLFLDFKIRKVIGGWNVRYTCCFLCLLLAAIASLLLRWDRSPNSLRDGLFLIFLSPFLSLPLFFLRFCLLAFSFWLKVCFPCCWSIIWFFEWCCASSFPVSPFCWLFSWIEDYVKASLVLFSCSFDILLFPYSLFFFPLSRSFFFFNSSSPLFIVQSSSMLPWCLHYMK